MGEEGLEMRDTSEDEPNFVDESNGSKTEEPVTVSMNDCNDFAGFCSSPAQYCCNAGSCCVDDAEHGISSRSSQY